jgi:hypothetical protein
MASSCKSDILYSLGIGSFCPRIEGFVVSFALDKMLFNNIYFTLESYYIYLDFGLV